jgi:hypothetical protein
MKLSSIGKGSPANAIRPSSITTPRSRDPDAILELGHNSGNDL